MCSPSRQCHSHFRADTRGARFCAGRCRSHARNGGSEAEAKPKRKGPPSSVTVINATANTATGIVITAGEKTTKLSKPLAPKGRATVRLPKLKGCTVSVAATFEGGGKSDAETFDVCKEKSIRFTD